MTLFLLAAAALVLVTLGLVTRPLWRQRPLAGAGVASALALSTVLVYSLVGTPDSLDPARRTAPATMDAAIDQLAAELARNPDQPEGWRILARAYVNQGRLQEASAAYAQALERAPDADVLVEAAETRARAAPDRAFDAKAIAMLQRALDLQPGHQRARWFLGISHRQAGRPADAARTWEPLLAAVDQKTGASLRAQIDAARRDAGLPALPATAATSRNGLAITVALAPSVSARVAQGASLFVIARVPGTVMPVAAEKIALSRFPMTLTLDDADSPMPTRKLSQLDRVEVLARISSSGDAKAQPGDMTSTPQTVDLGSRNAITLTIDGVVQ
ncbi:MAG: Cytochrome c heme lyase subunit CcmH [uncultured Lysobacter sp.]|uniref:Cytochrome c heme lyase subunit CcmH n=1 Tax=uncultured Lysobacter sp. TaxID=271060 RepID=A0A6J4L6Z2_9GAMM|nr:MAG: Cytochrome c heme lyase subunit CcmH [uncultured Lysobacter sp.]